MFIISARKIASRGGRRAEERLLKDSFEVELVRSIGELGQAIDHELGRLFEWRNKAKYGRAGLLREAEESCEQWRSRLQEGVYELVPEIVSILQADRETIGMVES